MSVSVSHLNFFTLLKISDGIMYCFRLIKLRLLGVKMIFAF